MSADEKEQKVEAVAAATAKLLWQHGVEGVTHARLARASGVSRAWLYKYVGNEKEDLLRFVTEHFGAMLGKFQTRPRLDSKDNWIDDSVQGAFVLMVQAQQFPWVMPLYFRYLGTDSELGRCIAEVEQRYLDTSTVEIMKVFDMPESRARWIAELMLTVRTGIAYRQALKGFVPMSQLEDLRKLLQTWSRAL
jgi:AcrR family transcriptional regulator